MKEKESLVTYQILSPKHLPKLTLPNLRTKLKVFKMENEFVVDGKTVVLLHDRCRNK